jgi:AraC family transcriptional regulator of arabinose operon
MEKRSGSHEMANHCNNPAVEDLVPDTRWVMANHFIRHSGYIVRRSKGSQAWLLFHTVGGAGCIRVNNEEFICKNNDIHILKPGTPHHYFTLPGSVWDFYWSYFIPRNTWSTWLILPELGTGVLSVSLKEKSLISRITSIFERLVTDCRYMDVIQHELALGAMEEILLLLYRTCRKGNYQHLDDRIAEVLEVISTRYSEDHTIENLAKLVCLSPSRLSHLYKESVGESILATLHRIRLEQAARLLQFSPMSVSEIAQLAGFQSMNYFAKKFKLQYRVSPSKFRS